VSKKKSEQSREIFQRFLQSKGLKLTRQRQAIIDEILEEAGHFEPDEIVNRLRRKKINASRATVYRTLELLRESQLVEKLDIGEAGALYEHVSADAHHDHLICTQCKSVIEFHHEGLERQQAAICQHHDFQETHHSLRIFGLCKKCRKTKT